MYSVTVNTKKELFPTAEDLYGLFFEDINRAGDGGLYPEMIRNRSFEDSLIPAGCTTDENRKVYFNEAKWPGAFNHGEGMDDWAQAVMPTDIPGWYCENAKMELTERDTLNAHRQCALRVNFSDGGRIWNVGYAGVPIKLNETYRFYMFVKADADMEITVSMEGADGTCHASGTEHIHASDTYHRVDCLLKSTGEDFSGKFVIEAVSSADTGNVTIGFTSLMPTDTYMGHGLRKDLVEMLKGLNPKFMRFPGGCVVEGMTEETAMRFSNTVGPVWERPSHNLMWHYRTSNGLGFHEYLQLCEDLQMEAMYVCNCGMSCQARHGKGFDEETVRDFLREALDAVEYALGSKETKFGALRAKMGHEQPFTLKYLEIGNENWGKEYDGRYDLFYRTIKEKYPQLILISNSHTERQGLPTEYVDEHYYNTPEFFMENDGMFDDYDRNGPSIFLGEYAVNGGNTIASMECAMAEAVFLTGVERNQDIVKLSAYAPLFQNSDYTAWKPNLIVFDNHRVYGIPSYHVISLFGRHRGNTVVDTIVDTDMKPPVFCGVPGIMCEKPGMMIKNVKINGNAADISRVIYGDAEEIDGMYILNRGGNGHHFTGKSEEWNKAFEDFIRNGRRPGAPDARDFMWVTFGSEDMEEYTFEADLKFESDNAVTLSVWNSRPGTDAGCNEPKDMDWNIGSVRNQIWKIENSTGVTKRRNFFDFSRPEPEKAPLDIDYGKFNTFKIVAKHEGYMCYINGNLVQAQMHKKHPVIYATCTTDEENVILKLVNTESVPADTEIRLDCALAGEVYTETVSAPPDSVNSMEQRENVSVKKGVLKAGGRRLVVTQPPHSVQVLIAKKA